MGPTTFLKKRKKKFEFFIFIMSSYICDELVDEIFKRLPSKSLLRFRSLSKSWCSHISSPDFILKQTTFQSARNFQNILIQHRTLRSENFYRVHYQSPLNSQYGNYGTRSMKFPNGCYMVGSCNGIICLRDNSNDVSLWNPSIRRKLDLPFLGYFSNNSRVVGFGFDSNTDDYMTVRLFYPGYGELYKSMVYSLKKRVWCEITPPSTHILRVRSAACFVNGALHWVVLTCSFYEIILTFDLSTQLFSEIMLPEEPIRQTICPIIFNGSLGMSISDNYYTHIWAMKEYKNNTSWYMVLKLENFQFEGGVDAVLQLKNGNILIRNYKNVYEVRYPGGECSEVCERDSPTVEIFGMVMYVESLALLDIGTACIDANQPYFTMNRGEL
ncbi:F-box/kelch-repeat protein At3g23880-like [Rutidosis leptorrhynchoides]|uniref:F-box/kelch-repeat protein At3g23880-like n=1 Tax=Rutidosis leptorrhynchoides TaxID=125765 RepID=UPI003A9A324C